MVGFGLICWFGLLDGLNKHFQSHFSLLQLENFYKQCWQYMYLVLEKDVLYKNLQAAPFYYVIKKRFIEKRTLFIGSMTI